MRLNIPTETTSLSILNGPGTHRMLDAALEKENMGYEEPTGPKLEFTVEHPLEDKPMKVTIEMIDNFTKVGDHYELDGLLVGSGQIVLVKYWLRDLDGFGRGSITDPVK